jgi:hypothetical protein
MLARDDSILSADVTREIEIDGVRFQVVARRLGDGWFGTWQCRYCRRHGVNGVVYQTAQTALDLTIEILLPHACRAAPREELCETTAGRFS